MLNCAEELTGPSEMGGNRLWVCSLQAIQATDNIKVVTDGDLCSFKVSNINCSRVRFVTALRLHCCNASIPVNTNK